MEILRFCNVGYSESIRNIPSRSQEFFPGRISILHGLLLPSNYMNPHFILVCTLLLCSKLFAQPEHIHIAKKADWVKDIKYNSTAKPDAEQRSSYYYLLIDDQENTVAQEAYQHIAYVILTSEGIQEMADLQFDFDPAYEELIFHELKIIRGASVINQLSKNIQVIQREESMERYLYDGTRTAVFNLKDIRVGDIVEYSFTRKGYNPVHLGHISRTFYHDSFIGVDKRFTEVTVSDSRLIKIKSAGPEKIPHATNNVGNLTSYSWSSGPTTPVDWDVNTPAWYENENYSMISDFPSWTEVGIWASTLFELDDADVLKIKNEISTKFISESPEAYALEVVQFVQDEIRYLGFESGINSHKPYPPVKVYEQRFGDCKDKSLLLITLLRARGIEAYPMLVNTSLKEQIDERLPAGNIFDHCVVKLMLNGKAVFIDPTISNQGGQLSDYYFPDYRRGLVIDESIDGLDSLPTPLASSITEEQTFEVGSIGGEAILTVRTTYTGSEAEYQRAEFARSSLESIQKNYQEYYSNLYPDIQKMEDLVFTDHRGDNVFKVEEKYRISTFWKPLENDPSKIYCQMYPQSMAHYFEVSKSIQQRKSPYRLSYPVDYHHHIHIKLPEDWAIVPEDEIIENDYYQYEHEIRINNNELSKYTHYKTKKDHIPAEHIDTYIRDHEKMWNNLVYQLSYDNAIAEAKQNVWPGLITTILTIVLSVFLMFRLYKRYDPEPELRYLRGTPIGGWLVLMALGILLTPLRLLYDLGTSTDVINGTGWLSWLTAKEYGYFAVGFISHVYNLMKLLFSVLLIVLFFERRSSFPRLMTIQLAAHAAMMIIDTLVARSLSDNPASVEFKDMIQAIISSAIWIPYLQVSKRVKETFVIRTNNDEPDDTELPEEAEVDAQSNSVETS
jgi:hypothetical protein